MTSLTDKIEGLKEKEIEADKSGYGFYKATLYMNAQTPEEQAREPKGTVTHTTGKATINLAKAEAAVVGDWETELESMKTIECFENIHYVQLREVKPLISKFLAAKDREIAEANKKGFIDGALSK